MTLKVQILQHLRRLFIILVGLTMTWFSAKMLIFNIWRPGLMPNMIKKSWTVSIFYCVSLFIDLNLAYFEKDFIHCVRLLTKLRKKVINLWLLPPKPSLKTGSVNKAFLFWYWQQLNFFFKNKTFLFFKKLKLSESVRKRILWDLTKFQLNQTTNWK